MSVSPQATRLFRRVAPFLFVATVACATATYDTPPDLDSGVAGAGSRVPGSAGSLAEAGSLGVSGSTTNTAGSSGSTSAGGSGKSSTGSGGSNSTSAAGAGGMAGMSMGGSSQAGATASGGAATGACTAAAWSATVTYQKGDKAKKGGKEYTAAYYTMTDPESHCCNAGQEWLSAVPCP